MNKLKIILINIFYFFVILLSEIQGMQVYKSLDLTETPQNIINNYQLKENVVEAQNVPRGDYVLGDNFYKLNVGDQRQIGTCSSFAVVDCLLCQHNVTLSPAYLNVKAKSLYPNDCSNSGLSIGMAMHYTLKHGTVMDWVWPYEGYYSAVEESNRYISNDPQPSWDLCIPSPYTDYQDKGLVKFSFENVQRVFSKTSYDKNKLIRDAILKHASPVVISIPVEWNTEWLPDTQYTGRIRTRLQQISGWHAISICGFNHDEKEFIFKNSWGSGWGLRLYERYGGYGRMTYEYITEYAREGWIGFGKKLTS